MTETEGLSALQRVPFPRARQRCKDPGKIVRKRQSSTCSRGAAGAGHWGAAEEGGVIPLQPGLRKTRVGGPEEGLEGQGQLEAQRLKRCLEG